MKDDILESVLPRNVLVDKDGDIFIIDAEIAQK